MIGLLFRLLLKACVPLGIMLGATLYMMSLQGHDPMVLFDRFGAPITSLVTGVSGKVGNLSDTVGSSIESQSRSLSQYLSKDTAGNEAVAGEASTVDEPRQLYKWRGANGSLHYGDNPPEGVEAISLHLEDNSVPAFKVPKAAEPVAETEESKPVTSPSELASPYSPSQVKKLFEDANQLKEIMEQRQIQQDEMLNLLRE